MGLNAQPPQPERIIRRQAHDAAEIVVQDAHIHALRRLSAEDLQNGVPHFSLVEDEVFQKNIVLRLFQVLAHLREAVLADVVIFCGGVVVDRIVRGVGQIARVVAGRVRPRHQRAHDAFLLRQAAERLAADALHFPVLTARCLVAAEQQIDRDTGHRKRQYQHDPRDLIGWVAPVGHDVDHRCP